MRFASPPRVAIVAWCLAAIAIPATMRSAAAAEEPVVLAVVACDGYADLKKQARWVGGLVDQPTLDGFLESFIMMATQFKGLAGLDVDRPAGVVVTAEGPAGVPVPRGFVPVKDLGKLLAALQGLTGPVEEKEGVRTIAPPGMPPIQIVEKDGWAIFSQAGSPDADTALANALDGIVKSFSLGVQVFPSKMPEELRQQFEALLRQFAAMQEQQGQPIDAAALAAGLKNLKEVESLLLGVNIDTAKERVYLENRTAMVPGSALGTLFTEAAKATNTVASPATADGKPAAVKMHMAMAVPESLREAGKEFPELPFAPAMLFEAMVDAGTIDSTFTVDTTAADFDQRSPLPAITVAMKVKDGAALEAKVKETLAQNPAAPNVTVKFDAGKSGNAKLHLISMDMTGLPNADNLGGKMDVTLAVAPDYAFLLTGGNVEQRLAAALAGSGKPDANAKPFAGLDLSLAPLLQYAVKMQGLLGPNDQDAAAALAGVAEQAAAAGSPLVQFLVRPLDRGMALRLSADAGAIKLLKVIWEAQVGSAARPGLIELQPGPGVPAIAP
jgi:hypothetical protein